MFKEDLLEKHDKIKLNILKKLTLNSGKICKNDLCKEFNISYPTLREYLKQIENLLKDTHDENIKIIDNKNYIFFNCCKYLDLEKLTLIIIRNSVKFKILKYLFENSSIKISYTKFCEELNVSKSTLNNKIVECNKILEEFNICIYNLKFEGSQIQIIYFLYLLFLNTEFNMKNKNFLYEKLVKFFLDNFNINLNLKQKYLLNILSNVLLKRCVIFKGNFQFDDFSEDNILILRNNKLFIQLKILYESIFFSKNIGKCLAYITICFVLSYDILPFNFIYNIKEFKNSEPYKIYRLITSEINKFYSYFVDDNKILKNKILFISYRYYFFRGILYSNEYITIKQYIDKFSSNTRINFAKYLLIKIKSISVYEYINDECFIFAILIILANINGVTKNSILIGVISYKDDLVLRTKINNLNTKLRNKFDVSIEIYNEYRTYDLVISSLSNEFDIKHENLYLFTNIEGEYDFNNILELVNEIDKYKNIYNK